MKKKLIILAILITILMSFCIKNITIWQNDNKKTKEIIKEVESITEDKFLKLNEINSDILGIIKVNNTNINYPFVQTDNNEYYIDHSLNKEKNNAGWIFMDYRSNIETSRNVILYGHGRYDGTMFGTIKNMLDPSWYNKKENLTIEIETANKYYNYEIFSLYIITVEDYYLRVIFNNDIEYSKFLNIIQERSINNFNTDLNDTKQILTLSTCIGTRKRAVIHAKLKEIVEKK